MLTTFLVGQAILSPASARNPPAQSDLTPSRYYGKSMPIRLKPVDVAVIGLGAAGGVAVLPLARAGLKIAGIEVGTWMDPHRFRPDEIYNNVRRLVTSVPKAQRE